MNRIEKKVWPEYFEAIVSGKKKFELRLQDFDVSEGDELVLKEWDPLTATYTGRTLEKKVAHVVKLSMDDLYKFWPKEEIERKGIQIISLET
jgi:ASC-1-like (ASCH) protein